MTSVAGTGVALALKPSAMWAFQEAQPAVADIVRTTIGIDTHNQAEVVAAEDVDRKGILMFNRAQAPVADPMVASRADAGPAVRAAAESASARTRCGRVRTPVSTTPSSTPC